MVKAAIPQGTAGIDSDFELAELLQQVPPALAAAVGQVYLDAVASIGSDFERKRVLVDDGAPARAGRLGRDRDRDADRLDANRTSNAPRCSSSWRGTSAWRDLPKMRC